MTISNILTPNRFYSFGLLAFAILVLAAPQAYAQDSEASEAIHEANERFMEAFAEQDAEAVAALYTDDALMYGPGAPPLRGPEAVEAYLNGMFDYGYERIELDTRVIKVNGDTAYELSDYMLFMEDGHPADHGQYTVVWKLRDGEWKLHRDIISSLGPPSHAATADELMDEFAAAWSRDDFDAVAGALATDVLVYDADKYTGRESIMEYWGGNMEATGEMTITPARSGGSGDMAYQTGRWKITYDGGMSEGAHTFIFHRTDDADWLVTSALIEYLEPDSQ